MQQKINGFVEYLTNVKHASKNTIASYRRDLVKLNNFLTDSGCKSIKEITGTNLNSYILKIEKQGFIKMLRGKIQILKDLNELL